MKENILNFALSPLCLVYMKFLLPSVLKLGCKRYIGKKQQVKIFVSSVKMSCLRCFCCVMRFLMPSVVKLVCKRCIGWKRWVRTFLLSVVQGQFLSLLWIENLGCLVCVEQICMSIIKMRYEFRKIHNGWRKLKLDWQSGRSMQTILSALLWFFKTMKDDKSGPEKYYYFLLPNDRSIQGGA